MKRFLALCGITVMLLLTAGPQDAMFAMENHDRATGALAYSGIAEDAGIPAAEPTSSNGPGEMRTHAANTETLEADPATPEKTGTGTANLETPASTAPTPGITETGIAHTEAAQEPSAAPGETETAAVEDSISITVSFAGDCTLGYDESFQYQYSFPHRLEMVNNDYSYFFRNVKPIFENDNLNLVNLETTFTNATEKAQKKFRFRGDPSYVEILKQGSIEMVNISNNHIYDYLQKGFEDTLETLDKAGIAYCGEDRIAKYKVKGITITCLGYKGWDIAIMDKIAKDLAASAETSDFLIVSFHWGEERSYYPNETQKKLARFCIDQGADVVVGHHPHVIQGIEKYKERYIAYSLGNFCFGGNRNPKDKDTFIFQIQFTYENNKISALKPVIIPCSISSTSSINDYQPTVLEGKEYERVMDRLFKYSSVLEWGITPSDLQSP